MTGFSCRFEIALTTTALLVGLGVLIGASPSWQDASVQQEADGQQETYWAVLSPTGDAPVYGFATFRVEGGTAHVEVNVQGVSAGDQHMQHVHNGAECSSIDGVLTPLQPYPTADDRGVYHFTTTLDTVPENLAERTVVVHGAQGSPVACGAVEPLSE